jgi:hypothetical protein
MPIERKGLNIRKKRKRPAKLDNVIADAGDRRKEWGGVEGHSEGHASGGCAGDGIGKHICGHHGRRLGGRHPSREFDIHPDAQRRSLSSCEERSHSTDIASPEDHALAASGQTVKIAIVHDCVVTS